jgi:hypothetical protein
MRKEIENCCRARSAFALQIPNNIATPSSAIQNSTCAVQFNAIVSRKKKIVLLMDFETPNRTSSGEALTKRANDNDSARSERTLEERTVLLGKRATACNIDNGEWHSTTKQIHSPLIKMTYLRPLLVCALPLLKPSTPTRNYNHHPIQTMATLFPNHPTLPSSSSSSPFGRIVIRRVGKSLPYGSLLLLLNETIRMIYLVNSPDNKNNRTVCEAGSVLLGTFFDDRILGR